VATLLADSPPASPDEQPPVADPSGAAPESASETSQRQCAKCGAPMDDGQGWCLQCGAAAPGSLATRTPGWRPTATILGATAILAIGAASAAYAALNKTEAAPTTAVVVPSAGSVGATPGTSGPGQLPSEGAKVPTTPTTTTPRQGSIVVVKPPKIPLTAATPKPAATTTPAATTPAATTPTTGSPTATTPTTGTTNSTTSRPNPILLDTNAVSTYNPNGYPASDFGEPSLTIDGETSTAWTAPVYPDMSPKMAVGLLIDLQAPQRLSELELISATPGMTVQVFGANGSAAPTTITDPAWVKLTKPLVAKNKHQAIKLGDTTTGFRFVTLWISRAPAAAAGTPQTAGRVSVNEIELFPAK